MCANCIHLKLHDTFCRHGKPALKTIANIFKNVRRSESVHDRATSTWQRSLANIVALRENVFNKISIRRRYQLLQHFTTREFKNKGRLIKIYVN